MYNKLHLLMCDEYQHMMECLNIFIFKSFPEIHRIKSAFNVKLFGCLLLYDFNNYLFNNMLLCVLICANVTFYLFGL